MSKGDFKFVLQLLWSVQLFFFEDLLLFEKSFQNKLIENIVPD